MQQIYFTSDQHFYHYNIIKLQSRDSNFNVKTIPEMHDLLIKNWNDTVNSNDLVYIVGDFVFGKTVKDHNLIVETLSYLKGTKILIKGNHDQKALKAIFFDKKLCEDMAKTKSSIKMDSIEEIRILNEKRKIILCHYPIDSWNGKYHGSIHIHGHNHGGKRITGQNRFNANVDSNNMTPVSLEEIVECLK